MCALNEVKGMCGIMKICEKYLEEEYNTIIKNEKIFKQVLKKLQTKEHMREEINNLLEYVSALEKVLYLKENYIYDSPKKEIKYFFDTLNHYHYNNKQEIKDAIATLNSLKSQIQIENGIEKLINSPYIQSIKYEKGQFFLVSEQYGKFKWINAEFYFQNEQDLLWHMKYNQLERQCHNHTYYLAQKFPNYQSITSLCPYYFSGFYHHSYTQTENNEIIDLCSKLVMPKEMFDILYEPEQICITKNIEVGEKLEEANQKTIQPNDRCKILKIALYQRALQEQNPPKQKIIQI